MCPASGWLGGATVPARAGRIETAANTRGRISLTGNFGFPIETLLDERVTHSNQRKPHVEQRPK
jgi:hypothetical protein